MKKIFLLPFLLFLAATSHASEANATLFEINEEEILAQVSELSVLENYVAAHQGISLTDVMNTSNFGKLNLDVNMMNNFSASFGVTQVAGIPSFLWGLILGPIGIAIVHFDAEDKQETKKALYGCLTQGGVWALVIAASYLFVGTAY